ncbi:MAG TPA: transcription antitermination factor NusB [Acidobacteriota bacterium]|nr:transcription antitermination factor NusB [Acidobacteriota bacterium]
MRRKAREYALQILYALDLNPVELSPFLKTFWDLNPAKPEVMEYASALVKGTIKKKKEIDSLITEHSNRWKIERMPVTDRNILRLGIYEFFSDEKVPSKVVINEAIEIAKKYGTTDSATFINGVLDSIHQKMILKGSHPVS